jgi:hypothetical protein
MSACLGVKNIGKPCAGKPHARFDEGGQARACSLLSPLILDSGMAYAGPRAPRRFDAVTIPMSRLTSIRGTPIVAYSTPLFACVATDSTRFLPDALPL